MTTATPGIRVFFALWPTAAERDGIAAWQPELKSHCGGRAMRADTLHSTLLFIGNIEPGRLESLQEAALQVRAEPFTLCFDEPRHWEQNHIVYAAPRNVPARLAALVASLEQRMQMSGYKFDQRRYQSHVTLLRNASCAAGSLPSVEPVCWQISEFVLLQSEHMEGRAAYRILSRIPLQGPEKQQRQC